MWSVSPGKAKVELQFVMQPRSCEIPGVRVQTLTNVSQSDFKKNSCGRHWTAHCQFIQFIILAK